MKITVGELRQLVRESIVNQNLPLDEGWKDWVEKGKKLIGKWFPVAVISLGAVACDKQDINSFRCEGFTEEEIAIMQDAADEWCERTDNVHCAVIGKEGDSKIKLLAYIGEKVVGRQISNIGENPSSIQIKNTRDEGDWEAKLHATIMHELGHHFAKSSGFNPGHLKSQEDGIMAHDVNVNGYVSDKDVKYVRGELTKDDLM